MNRIAALQGGRSPLRLPLSPVKAEMALKALEGWQEPVTEEREKHWYRIANAAAGSPTQVNIFDEISWWGISAQQFIEDIALIPGDLEVHINSPGGDAFDGIAIYNALASRAGVTTVVDGLAASAASVIAMAGQKRIVSPGAMLMIHDALALCIGNAADMRETAGLLDKVSDNIAGVYAAHTETSADDWRAVMTNEGWYTAQEAVDAGLAHELAARPAPAATAAPEAAFRRDVFARWHGQLADKAMPVHHTATVDTSWDGPAAVAAMPNDDTVLEYCHAWQDSAAAGTPHKEDDDDADDQKSNYKFPHHQHKGGPANLAGCRNGLARLSGADIPDGDRAGVKAHLQAHLDDAKGAGDHADPGFGIDPEQLLKALKEGFK